LKVEYLFVCLAARQPAEAAFLIGATAMPNGTATAFTRMPHALLESIASEAVKEDRSMSGVLRVLVKEALQARGAYPKDAK
jgi:hypothetical protein